MDPKSRALSPASSSFLRPTLHSSSDTSFPIIAIAVIGILATALLLVGYYIFVIKCCLTWHRIDLLRRLSLSRGRAGDDPLAADSPDTEPRGLEESVIRSIPIFRYRKGTDNRDFPECAVCLNELEEDEKLRMIPKCCHVFHIDCIDVWLQGNANCPLCRTAISGEPTASSGDEDFVVIELGGVVIDDSANGSFPGRREMTDSGELAPAPAAPAAAQLTPRKVSMGDECIDIRGCEDEQFQVQPMRRSISMDSSVDRKLEIEEMVSEQKRQGGGAGDGDGEASPVEGCSSSDSAKMKRSFFSFGHGSRGSRSSSILPLHL